MFTARSSFMPTPVDPLADLHQENMEAEGHAMVLYKQAKEDTKRYTKLFKKHVEANNSHFKIVVTKREISIAHETAGITETNGVYAYKAGVAKALYCSLVGHGYKMTDFLRDISDHGFAPFPDNEYFLVMTTPEPHDSLKSQFKLIDGKWF